MPMLGLGIADHDVGADIELVVCHTVAELRARLRSARPFAAVVVAGELLDADLVGDAGDAGVPIVPIGPRCGVRRGADAATILRAAAEQRSGTDAASWPGPLVAVTGSGGTGASTVARAVAEDLAASGRRRTLLADLCLDAELAALHGLPTAQPGIFELVHACRVGHPACVVEGYTVAVDGRSYRLLPGLHARRAWSSLRPRAVAAALESILTSFDVVVADVDADVDGEHECGSIDVEERNVLARTAMQAAAVVIVVAGPGNKGALSSARVVRDLTEFGVEPRRVVTVGSDEHAVARVTSVGLDPPPRPPPRRVRPGTLGW